jgi:hypothetical protein
LQKTGLLAESDLMRLLNEAALRQKKIIDIGNSPSNTLQLSEVAKNLKTT